MILTDTSVLIRQYRSPDLKRYHLIRTIDPVVCGVTVAEMYAGTRTAAQHSGTTAILAFFGRIQFPEPLWETVGHHSRVLLANGLTVPFADVMIATLAMDQGLELWTYDTHFAANAAFNAGIGSLSGTALQRSRL